MAGSRRVTVRDIASKAGVSPATVSAALRTETDDSSIGAETRERVLEIANRLGYDYSRLRPRNRRTRAVALFMPGVVPPNVSMLYHALLGLSQRLSQHGLRVLLECGHEQSGDPEAGRDIFTRGEAEAAIGYAVGEQWATQMAQWGVPSVYIGPTDPEAPVCSVNVDDALGGRAVAEHLWSLGHRNVGIVHMFRSEWGEARASGIRSVWERFGRSIPPARVQLLTPGTGRSDGAQIEENVDGVVRALLAGDGNGAESVTAIFCDADWVASRALRSVRSLGLRVPEDVSVVGFDDAHFAPVLDPPLTTVRQPVREICALAIELLLEQLSVGEPIVRSYSLPCELVVRNTTGPVKN
ncbi:MAG TPA: LacI family DNA-binding transcriptional regulator [Armatimonadota bacterium]|nr:LacI family DNA-binding transcriptional regulator [Armatimonadota bacterium]